MAKILDRPIVNIDNRLSCKIYNKKGEGDPLFLSQKTKSNNLPVPSFQHFSLFPLGDKSSKDIFKEIIMQGKARKVMKKLREDGVTAQGILESLSKHCGLDKFYNQNAGVSEDYTVGQHTERVLKLALKHQGQLKPEVTKSISWDVFLLFLALHDIGKGVSKKVEAIEKYKEKTDKERELLCCQDILKETMTKLNIPSALIFICKAMLKYNSLGDYISGNYSSEEEAKRLIGQIKDMAEDAGLPPVQFLDLFQKFHLVDFGSYPSLKRFLDVGRDDKGNFTIHYGTVYNSIYENLKMQLKAGS